MLWHTYGYFNNNGYNKNKTIWLEIANDFDMIEVEKRKKIVRSIKNILENGELKSGQLEDVREYILSKRFEGK